MKGNQAIKCLNDIREFLSDSASGKGGSDPSSISEQFFKNFFWSDNQSETNCIILRAFLHDRKKCSRSVKSIFGDIHASGEIQGLAAEILPKNSLSESIRLRAAHVLLMCRIQQLNAREIEDELDYLLKGYERQFATSVWRKVDILVSCVSGSPDISGLDPWFVEIKRKGGTDGLIEAFREIAIRTGGIPAIINPAFFFLLHSTIVLLSEGVPNVADQEGDWDIGTAWGVTAVENSAVIKEMGIYGSVFKLRVRESLIGRSAPQRFGIPYPCPVNGAYLRFDDNFQRGVVNAWLLNRKFEESCENVVYSLAPFCDPKILLAARSSRLVGDSMAAAFGIALRSRDLRQRLRDDAVCSCSINFDGTDDYANENLSPVGSISRKMIVIDIFSQMNTDHRLQIKVFYVAQNEEKFGLPNNVELRGDISHYSVLYDRMTLNERLIEEFCQNKSERWTRIGGRDPYQE